MIFSEQSINGQPICFCEKTAFFTNIIVLFTLFKNKKCTFAP